MKAKDYLDIEIRLLLIKYGKQACLKAFAGVLDHPPQLLELDIMKMRREITPPSTQTRTRTRTRTPPSFNINAIIEKNPSKESLLRKINSKFESKDFLPELKDVRRFFDRYKGTSPTFKSRAAAQPKLLELIASIEKEELEKLLIARSNLSSQSSLGLISDEILRQKRDRDQ